MNSILWFAIGVVVGWILFKNPEYITQVGVYLQETGGQLKTE